MSDTATTAPMRHVDMLRMWPIRSRLVRALNDVLKAQGARISETGLQSWETRNSIPARYWPALAALARQDGHQEITEAALQEAARLSAATSRRRGRPPKQPS